MNQYQRIILFFLICIPLRLYLAYWAIVIHTVKHSETDWNNNLLFFSVKRTNIKILLESLCLAIGLSFIYQFFKGNMIGGFGGKVWWGNLRLVHAFNYLAYAILSYNNIEFAYVPLLLDVIIGLIRFLVHRISIDGWS